MRLTANQLHDAMHDVAPCHARNARADNRICLRGVRFVQKLWRLHWHNERINSPLPAIRGKR